MQVLLFHVEFIHIFRCVDDKEHDYFITWYLNTDPDWWFYSKILDVLRVKVFELREVSDQEAYF